MGTDIDCEGRSLVDGRGVDVEEFWPSVVRYCRARIGRRGGEFSLADGVARDVCAAVVAGWAGGRGRPFVEFVYRTALRE
ncbi:MAG TPA: RNA polymerase subunit sigma, partial [Umezawaea sp.]|nr:RNA polymerase subunit sigma [Umezawaea sp.]